MKKSRKISTGIVLVLGLVLVSTSVEAGDVCKGYGPQAPRDIDNRTGENKSTFSMAPNYTEMNLCHLHFHVNAENKAQDFSIYAGEGVNGLGGGYKCNDSTSLTKAELQAPKTNFCKDVKPGDTIEVHWVYTCCGFRRKLPPIPEITLPLIPSSNSLVDSNTKVAGLRQLFA